jgi:hypothetical protein
MFLLLRIVVGSWALLTPLVAHAQGASALARQTQNPVASLVSVPIQANWDSGLGERETTGTLVNVQPVMPFSFNEDWNVILRVVMPFASQATPAGPTVSGMGDTVTTVFLSPANASRFIWGAGPVFLLPTATTTRLGAEKIGMGPSIVALGQPGRVTLGVLFNQIWSISGANDRPDVSQMLLQPFFNYNLGDGLSMGAVSEASANWTADANRWTVPLLFTVSKVAVLGRQPVNFQAAAGPYLDDREQGAEWRLRLSVTLLFPRSMGSPSSRN